jgi:transposase
MIVLHLGGCTNPINRRPYIMDYIRTEADGQLAITQSSEFLLFPSCLYGFHNTSTETKTSKSGRTVHVCKGILDVSEEDRTCTCGCRMNINNHPDIVLSHLCLGGSFSCVVFPHNQFRCPKCGATKTQFIPFKADRHRITEELYQYTRDLLALGTYTNKQVAEITGLGKNTVKDIDRQRLEELYTVDGKLIRPERQARYLGIDEFKLHDGRRYATHIIDMETGHILWIANGKKKQVVYDFIDHVGLEWMDGVEAVACDMNSDFQEAFEERCPHIQPVFDHFHLVRNFNDQVVSEVRKDEQRRLYAEGNIEAARALKQTKYILTAKRSTLSVKDAQAADSRVIHKGSRLFGTEDVIRKGGNEERYDALLRENRLLFTLDLIKEKLSDAYSMSDEPRMAEKVIEIMDLCKASGNHHLLWFGKLIDSHFEGIIAHATYKLSSGKIEGINQKIKTLRRHGYGYPDDEYFFLKLFDMSRKDYVRNPPSHRIYD